MSKDKTLKFLFKLGTIVAMSLCGGAALGQEVRQYTTADYAAAERFMPYNVNPLAYKGQVHAHALNDGRFWYREVDQSGTSYILLDPQKGTRGPAFDQAGLAAGLNAASGGTIKSDG